MVAADARPALARVTRDAEEALDALWRRLLGLSPEEMRDALMEALPLISARYGDAAASLGASWYEALRDEAEVAGSFSAVLPEQPGPARWESLVRWGMAGMFLPPDLRRPQEALTLIKGGLQRSVADQHRLTVVESSIADPGARGWGRRVSSGACDFCKMLRDRGGVYTEKTVSFKSHDHCSCYAAPVWDAESRKTIAGPYVKSKRRVTDADRARTRKFLRENY